MAVTSPTSSRSPFAIAALVTAGIVLVLLYGVFPYQHGHFTDRSSVIAGVLALVKLDAEWIFCPFVPILVGYLIYRQRDEILAEPLKGSLFGLFLALFSLLVYWMGYKADTRYLGFASAQIMVAALIFWFGGWRLFKMLLFPWIFLAFTWPMLPLEKILAVPLRHISAGLAANFLSLIGIDTLKEGTALVSAANPAEGLAQGERYRLDVAEACSGLRSLFSLMMISALFGYLTLPKTWQRLVLFAAAIPLAILGNFFRLQLLAFGTLALGSEVAVGVGDSMSFYHEMSGFVVFGVALFGMFTLARILEKIGGKNKKKKRKKINSLADDSDSTGSGKPHTPWSTPLRWVIPVVLAVAAVLTCKATPVGLTLAEPGLSMNLPVVFGAYQSRDNPMSTNEKDVFEPGVELVRRQYGSPDGHWFMATMVMSGPINRSLHQPEVCLPGQGWEIITDNIIDVPTSEGLPLKATLLELARSYTDETGTVQRVKAYDIYWYVGRDVSTPSYNAHVILSHRDGIFRNINHRWGMASFFAQLPPLPMGESDPIAELAAKEQLIKVTSDMLPYLEPEA